MGLLLSFQALINGISFKAVLKKIQIFMGILVIIPIKSESETILENRITILNH